MKFTINNNLRLLTCPLLLAGAVCCSSGNDGDTPAPGPGPCLLYTSDAADD